MQREVPGPWIVRQTTLEVDRGLLKKNFFELKKRAGRADLLVLLKSDAYGHSHREIVRTLDRLPKNSGLYGYGVANVEEGIELRRVGIRRPVFVMSGVQRYTQELHRCLETCDLTPVISSLAVLKQAGEVTRKNRSKRTVHLKFNTGMNRLGFDEEEINRCIALVKANPQLQVTGLLSHLASGEKPASARAQANRFRRIVAQFREAGIHPEHIHLANSAGLAGNVFPEGTLARVGLHLYGVGDPKLHPIARWTAQIYQVRELKKGDAVGYGGRFRAPRKMRMAVLGVGYGDGYRRLFSNRAEVLLKGKRCPVIGSVSMDLTAIDISRVPTATVKDQVVLLGKDGRDEITADELAEHAETITWEILTGISTRVPRVFR